jgi:hypothetical protein
MEPTRAVSCRNCGLETNIAEDLFGGEITCPHCGQRTIIASLVPTNPVCSGMEVYNIVTDTVTGINVRWKDNIIQFAVIVACVPIGALVGAFAVQDWRPGVIIGGFVGLLVGFFGSGIFLMVYRFVRHMRNDHR